ncbi:cbb3-type cytochrome c oxidase subunit I [Altererythrobacter sp. KTW20L]|uniref:cbb3-type cytochrome c oxidase subunit I n=1 Tax=Altererythrobacter sp. KTW20L TaxID=2942210 RepID=UPI0020C0F160|nr:cbb3-type cytochrome c oxidase subunit I [Altererythrobacter sp. KTW20L]
MKSETGFDHALYDRFPTAEARPQSEVEELKHIWAAPKGWGRLTIVNNNFVGVWYVAAAFLFFLLAGVLALVMRAQLSLPMLGVLPQETYNQFFTMHGTIMMFLFAVPMMEALGVMLLPQMLGARDLPFPRLSAYAFWAYFIGGLAFFCSLFFGLAPDGGWFMYPPLTSTTYSPGINADFWLLGIGFIEISAIAGAIEILVGILKTRAPGMTLARMPLFAWAMLVFAAMILIAFPSVILATLLLELERALNWPFFDATRGGDPMLWQHLFWFFGHPEVYIIFLPAAGLVSMMVASLAKTELVGYQLIVLAMVATGFISFGVWAHHMFTTGMPRLSIAVFSAASMAVSIPAGIQVFSWIATLATGKPSANTPTLFVIGGLVTFVMGGLTGVMVAMVPFDWQAHDTHFIVAHLHYVLIGGAVFPLIAAFYYWFGMSSDRRLSEKLGRWVFGLMFAGMHITFLPMHLTGLMGMPRRVYTYLPGMEWEWTNLISTVGAFIMGAGVVLLLYDLARNFRFTVEGGVGNTYGGGTLEWLPTGIYSARSIPVVRSRHPLWDNPDLAREVEEGRHFLPYAPTGRRETLITSPLQAEPQYLAIIMGPSVWPLLAAAFTAGVFLLLTVQAYIPSLICLPLAILCIMRWLWDTDRKVGMDLVDVGAGVTLPTYVTGPSTHGWWAMVCVLVVAGMIFTMAVFGYLFTMGVHPQFWTAPQGRWWAVPVVALYAGAAALVFYGNRLMAREKSASVWSPTAAMLFAAGLVATALTTDWFSWQTEGLDPQLTVQGAFSHALLALQGQLVAVVVLMAIYLAARTARGLVTRPRNTTFDLLTLFFLYACAQGSITAMLIRLVPA